MGKTFFLIVTVALLLSCSDSNSKKVESVSPEETSQEEPEEELQEERVYVEDRLLREFVPPNNARWYEYDERTVRYFGAGCKDAYCHHYIIHTDSAKRIIDCIYSNDYYCRDFIGKDGKITDLRTIKEYYCDSIEPIKEKPPYKIIHIYDENDSIVGYDSVSIELFNARDRFK
ncbi:MULTISPECIES: hypothetical protein [unclassified Fibrobacter]|uniref:hypothetical protein n=1 Tax=unclassified Fibrobacter TaxID=2634177 RepID=UPI000D6B83F1|nr:MULTISPECIES: hypothetical protein [unclassified Fibrobacter]PWJ60744.1 hypothetical protein BGX12_13614 [Fibrobacter sp. UWR4]PZW64360.1 hypothetical protein C8E88_103814 [Fibrobacter sp. UWR1]